jgi:hypothetical protein
MFGGQKGAERTFPIGRSQEDRRREREREGGSIGYGVRLVCVWESGHVRSDKLDQLRRQIDSIPHSTGTAA